MRKRILAFGMAVVLMVTGVGMDVSAERAASEEVLRSVQERCGLCPLVELELPEAEAENYLEKNQYSAGDFSQEEMEDASSWAQYGTKFIYNQLGEEQKEFWDTLDAMGMGYLGSRKNASNYYAWYGTEFVSYKGMEADEARKIVSFFLLSNPQYYFFMPGYSLQEETPTSGAFAIQFDERVKNGQTRAKATKEMKKIIDESVAQIEKEETELDKEKAAHDLICERVVYDYDLSDENAMRNQTIYSVFLTDKTVCAGYSQAMQLLCNAVGIDCIAVTSETHEWNMLRVNDIWYCVDLTWNDGDDNTVQYLFFNRSEEKLLELETGGQGQAEHHVPEDQWAGYLPPASRDSGAGEQDIGIVHTPEGQTAAPQISIDDYGTVTIGQEQGADVYYTMDGGIPSVARSKSERYQDMFQVGRFTDVKAMAAKDGWWDSEVVSFEWPVETVQAYAGQPFVYYSHLKDAESYQAEGLERLEIAGNPAVFDETNGKLKWNPDLAQIGETYEIIISAKDHKGRMMAEAVSLCVEDSQNAQLAIVGPKELALTEGYAATGTGSFSVTGGMKNPKFTLRGNMGAGKASWNQEERQIEIASGLKEGIYDMVLEAREEDGGRTEQFAFRLRIRAPQERNHLPVFQSPSNIVHALPGKPIVFYVKASDEDLGDKVTFANPDLSSLGENAQFDVTTGKFSWTPEPGMEGQTYRVTFSASDHVGSAVSHTVEIRVDSLLEDKSYAASEDTWMDSSYAGNSTVYGDAIFLRANRDAAGELGEKNVSSRSGNKIILLKFQLQQIPAVQEVILSLTYICKRSNAGEKTSGKLRVASVDGFEWSEGTATWAAWNSWRQSSRFAVEADAVAESVEYELDDTGKSPNEISPGVSFQGVKVKVDVTKLVHEALKKGQKELTLLVNTKEKGEEFFVSREGANAQEGFIYADASMAPSLEIEAQFAISGPQEMTLADNYPFTETDSFAISGTEQETAVSVNVNEMISGGEVTSGDGSRAYHDFIAWNEDTHQLEIRPGLPKGDYCVTLTAQEQAEGTKRQAVAYFYLHITADSREQLKALCEKELTREDYTDTSWARYQAALTAAEAVLQNSSDEDEIKRAVALLNNAQEALETMAQAWVRISAPYLVEEAAKDRYTPASWQAYWKEAAKLKDLPENITEEELYLRLEELKRAYDGLVRAADKRALKALLDGVNVLALSEYTEESAAYLIKVRDEAQKVYENANATQNEVDAAYSRLVTAKAALVAVPKEKQDKTGTKTKTLKDGQNYTDTKKGLVYRVTSVSKKTVKVVKGKKKNAKSLAVPATVNINGIKCSVTEIGSQAFQGFSKLKTVTIGSHVKKIGKKSFYNCRKLSSVRIKGLKINAVQGKAFGKTAKKVRVSFPKKMGSKQKKALKKKLKQAGLKM